jgi:hypothetical protein
MKPAAETPYLQGAESGASYGRPLNYEEIFRNQKHSQTVKD